MSLPNEFFITLASDESSDFFNTKNKQPSFTNKLPSPLLLSEGYSVALTEIYIPPFSVLPNFDGEINEIFRGKRSSADNRKLEIKLKDMNMTLTIPVDKFQSNTASTTWSLDDLFPLFFYNLDVDTSKYFENPLILHKIKLKLNDIKNAIKVDNILYHTVPLKIYNYFPIYVPYQETKDGVMSQLRITMPIKKYFSLYEFFHTMIANFPPDHRTPNMLLTIFKKISLAKDYDLEVLKQIKNVFLEVANTPIINHGDDALLERRFSVNHPNLRMLFVYCDIVSSQIYANRMLNLLRVIPFYQSMSVRDGIHIKFDSPEFYPLSKEYFESISIIVSARENEIYFNDSNRNPIYMKLLFKRM